MSQLDLLLVHADDHTPVVDGLDESAAHRVGAGFEQELPEHLWKEGGDGNDLRLQRWSVIAPEGPEGDRLLDAVDPLIKHRAEQQGAPVVPYRVPAEMSLSDIAHWRRTEFDKGVDLRDELPRFQLILGDLHQVPLALQQRQQTDGYVGRLAFDREEDYAAYVDKLLRWEGAPSPATQARALFATVHDRTAATSMGYKHLVEPSLTHSRAWRTAGKFKAADIVEVGDRDGFPDPNEFLGHLGGAEPAVLFSMSHGEGAPRGGWDDAAEMRRRQGAMSFGREGKIAGEDLGDTPFLPGGFWFMFACFGAGTPGADGSKFRHWLERLKADGEFRGNPDAVLRSLPQSGERPFIAALPKRVLANPNGPLAFMGHIDLAWTYSFRNLDGRAAQSRPATFGRVLKSVLDRDRAGVAFGELALARGQAETELAGEIDEQTAGRLPPNPKRGHLWMLRQDLLGYITLGDPAARLPLTAPVQQQAAAFQIPGLPPRRPPTPAPRGGGSVDGLPDDLDLEDLEEAIGRLWVGDAGAAEIAASVGLDKATLRRVARLYSTAGRAAIGRDT